MRTAVEPGEELVAHPTDQDGAAFDLNRFEAVLRQFFKPQNRDELWHEGLRPDLGMPQRFFQDFEALLELVQPLNQLRKQGQ